MEQVDLKPETISAQRWILLELDQLALGPLLTWQMDSKWHETSFIGKLTS